MSPRTPTITVLGGGTWGTRSLHELTRLGVAMGGRAETLAGLAGMGDLIVTCISPYSRDRHVGAPGHEV